MPVSELFPSYWGEYQPLTETKKGLPPSEAVPLCGQWDNYRTNFEDFEVVYLFGLQMPLIIHLFVQKAVYTD